MEYNGGKISATLFDDKGQECHIGDTIQCTTYSNLKFKGELTAVTTSSIDILETKYSSSGSSGVICTIPLDLLSNVIRLDITTIYN